MTSVVPSVDRKPRLLDHRVARARLLSLCSGYGGLDLAVEAVFGAQTIAHAEYEAAPSKVLAARWPGVPNLGDITTIRWESLEPVDMICAGYPCQPFSDAGQRKAEADERHIFPHIADAIGVLRPRIVVLENVRGHLVRGFTTVLGALADLGFDAEWQLVRASDVGAPHRRARLFVVATNANGTPRGLIQSGRVPSGSAQRAVRQAGRRTGRSVATSAADTASDGRNERRTEPARLIRGSDAAQRSATATDADSDGLESIRRIVAERRDPDRRDSADTAWGQYEPAIRRWERQLGRLAPLPTEPSPRGGQRLSPRFVEWLMGLPAGWVTDIPGISRNEQLKMLGNGVVPQQAEAALRLLTARAAA